MLHEKPCDGSYSARFWVCYVLSGRNSYTSLVCSSLIKLLNAGFLFSSGVAIAQCL